MCTFNNASHPYLMRSTHVAYVACPGAVHKSFDVSQWQCRSKYGTELSASVCTMVQHWIRFLSVFCTRWRATVPSKWNRNYMLWLSKSTNQHLVILNWLFKPRCFDSSKVLTLWWMREGIVKTRFCDSELLKTRQDRNPTRVGFRHKIAWSQKPLQNYMGDEIF